MRAMVAAAVLGLLTAPAGAQDATEPGFGHFRHQMIFLADDAAIAGDWIALLPTIADQCGMRIDKGHTQLLVNTSFRDPQSVGLAANRTRYLARNGMTSALEQDWEIIRGKGKDAACKMADDLWGEDGSQFPGVLRRS